MLSHVVDLWLRLLSPEGPGEDENADAWDDLMDEPQVLAALVAFGEKAPADALEVLLRIQAAPMELEDEVFGDLLSEAWESLILTIATEAAQVERLADFAGRRDLPALGRMAAVTGLSTLAREVNAHPLRALAAERLARRVRNCARPGKVANTGR